jgi:hypothetical protein
MLAEVKTIRECQRLLAERLAALSDDLDEPRRTFERVPLMLMAIRKTA